MSRFNSTPFGKYELLEQIAIGGMAVLYKARLRGDSRDLVVKQILPEHSENQEYIDMFMTEARVGVNLIHPHIVPVYELGIQEGIYYIAMEFVPGQSLGEVLDGLADTGDQLTLGEAIVIAANICSALEHAHTRVDDGGRPLGIIHRDVTPDNVLVSYQGQVKLTDFGLAKAQIQSHVTRVGAIKGKLGYMAPEQLTRGGVDHRSDIFGVGLILYEMLVLRPLYARDLDLAALFKLAHEPPDPRASLHRPDVPPGLDKILSRALAKDPEERFASAGEMEGALLRMLTEEGGRVVSRLGLRVKTLFLEPPEDEEVRERTPAPENEGYRTLGGLDRGGTDPQMELPEEEVDHITVSKTEVFRLEDLLSSHEESRLPGPPPAMGAGKIWVTRIVAASIIVAAVALTYILVVGPQETKPVRVPLVGTSAQGGEEAWSALQEGHAALEEGRPERALELARLVLSHQPDLPQALSLARLSLQALSRGTDGGAGLGRDR